VDIDLDAVIASGMNDSERLPDDGVRFPFVTEIAINVYLEMVEYCNRLS